MTAADPTALSLERVSVRYGRATGVLHEATLSVGAGEVVTLMGLNGAGKSTIARTATGLLGHHRGVITAGTVIAFGQDITRHSPRRIVRHGVAQVMEGRRVFSALTVLENLAMGGITVSASARETAQERVFDLFPQLADRRSQAAGLLSGGEQQMLALGRALMTSPRLLILDEPTLGLSPRLAALVGDTVRTIKQGGTSVLLIEQNTAIALAVADRGYIVEHGHIVRTDTAARLRDDPDLSRLMLGLDREDVG